MTLIFNQEFPTLKTVTAKGTIRNCPDDFRVTEINNLEFSSNGEHLWLYIQKTNSNTNWVAKQLSNVCQVPQRQVGYAGLKDRNAITEQWFSVQLAKVTDITKIQAALPDAIKIIKHATHSRKIKTGQLDFNQFEIIIRNISGNRENIDDNIANIITHGVPNYFGPQRFGHAMGNIAKVSDWFAGNAKVKSRNLKSILISTARSHIFNLILAHRIKANTWNKVIAGDILQLNKSKSWFPASDATTAEINVRLQAFDIHITAAMWGENQVQTTDACAQLENHIAQQFPIYQKGFEQFKLKQDRRAMRIYPLDFNHSWQKEQLKLSFKLLPGAYATGIIREILAYNEIENCK